MNFENSKSSVYKNENLNNEESEIINTTEIKTFDEGMNKISELVVDLKKSIPNPEHLTDIYTGSLSPDHYHSTRSVEVAILMMLKAKVNLISDELSKYKNFNEPDSAFSKALICPPIETIQELRNILDIKTGTSRAHFLDADKFKISDIVNTLQETVVKTESLYKEQKF